MTADDVIAANPETRRDVTTVKGADGLVGTRGDGSQFFVMWSGDKHIDCAMPLRADSIAHMRQALRDAQPGKEFATIWGDKYAERMRALGLLVDRDADGEPHVYIGSPVPHRSVAADPPQEID